MPLRRSDLNVDLTCVYEIGHRCHIGSDAVGCLALSLLRFQVEPSGHGLRLARLLAPFLQMFPRDGDRHVLLNWVDGDFTPTNGARCGDPGRGGIARIRGVVLARLPPQKEALAAELVAALELANRLCWSLCSPIRSFGACKRVFQIVQTDRTHVLSAIRCGGRHPTRRALLLAATSLSCRQFHCGCWCWCWCWWVLIS